MNILKVFNIPLVRHIIAAVAIIFGIWTTIVSPLQRQNTALLEMQQKSNERQYKLILELSKKPTYHIENDVDLKKQKDGSTVNFVPDNVMVLKNNLDSLKEEILQDEEKITSELQEVKKKTWAGRQLKKIGDWFR